MCRRPYEIVSRWEGLVAGLGRQRWSARIEQGGLKRALTTVGKLSDALKNYWISSGDAAAAEQSKRDSEKSKQQ